MTTPRPVLPGAEETRQSYANLARAWARKGKVVVLPQAPAETKRRAA